ncbi:radical SAM family heme chaperone HemW [Magnetovibrio sp.]|uniref:radical SAM family heme chaperone HemW n=1 Tax=Magnetovibrio sp. TaxID=2024836 RepID=UPI002F94EEC8
MATDRPHRPDVNAPLALYVHWPWCLSKCPYCDFNSRPLVPGERDQIDYRGAILRELEHYAQQTNSRPLSSIFFGGGTPSLIAPATIHAIIDAAQRHWSLQSDCEITLEANPTSIEAAKFRAFQDAGVNRVSIGVQALNDEDLQALGREHSVDEALRALDIASAIFNRYTFDLIYARPGQGQGDWADELEQALSLANGHVSLYQLTIEPGTAFFRQNRVEAEEDLAADLYQMTQEMCEDAGLPAYEVSNHAKPGLESRHNLTYWTGGDYIGVGPGAHGRLTAQPDGATGMTVTRATHQIADPARWLESVSKKGHATAKVRELSRHERLEELVLSGLRLRDGLDAARFVAQCGQDLATALNAEALSDLQQAELIEVDTRGVRTTAQGRLILNAIIARLLDEPPLVTAPA